jgi:exonuclease VII large subunit
MRRVLDTLLVAAIGFTLLVGSIQAHEEDAKPGTKPPSAMRKEMNLPQGAQLPAKKPNPSPKEKALAAQLAQLEKRRDALISKSAQLGAQLYNTQDPAERERLKRERIAVRKELGEVIQKRTQVYKAWQKTAMERWRRENPEAFQTPRGVPPGMQPGTSMPPQVIAKQIQIAQEQLAKLKKEGKPDTDPQVKMYKERIERYQQMLKSSAAKPAEPVR